jgi:hypothetical protein
VVSAGLLRVLSLYWSLTDVCTVQSSSEAHRESLNGRRHGRHRFWGAMWLRRHPTGGAWSERARDHASDFISTRHPFVQSPSVRGSVLLCPSPLLLSHICCILIVIKIASGVFQSASSNLLSCSTPRVSSRQWPGLLHSPHQVAFSAQHHTRLTLSTLTRYHGTRKQPPLHELGRPFRSWLVRLTRPNFETRTSVHRTLPHIALDTHLNPPGIHQTSLIVFQLFLFYY